MLSPTSPMYRPLTQQRPRLRSIARRVPGIDPRWWQIAALSAFIVYALVLLHAAISPWVALLFLFGCVGTEWCFARLRAGQFDYRSPLITALSLTLLLRVENSLSGLALALLAALLAIGSKHLLRVRGKQVFNPSNIAIVLLTCSTSLAWISPGTWGHAAMQVGLIAGIGMLITARATRLDLALTFIALWAAALLLRAQWLGEGLAIPLHQLCDGTLLIFSFFMITDPRATPDRRASRMLFAVVLVTLAYVLRFHFYQPDALLWALACVSPLSPVLDRLLPAQRFQWRGTAPVTASVARSGALRETDNRMDALR